MASSLTLVVNTVGLILFLGTLMGVLAERYKLPKMIPLLLGGLLISFIQSDIIVDITDDSIKDAALVIAEIGLLLILYQEGMHISLRQLRENILPITLLAVIGTILTTTLVGITITFFASTILGSDAQFIFLGSLLMASIVVPTDPAATFSILRSSGGKVKKHLETILGGESAFNDVIAIMLVIVILLPQVEAGNQDLLLTFEFLIIAIWQLLGGILLGAFVCIISLFFITKINKDRENASLTLASVFAIFAIAPIVNVSAAIAALAAGILLANPQYVKMKRRYTDAYMTPFWDKVVFLIEIFAFTSVGFLLGTDDFLQFLPLGFILSLIVIAVRLLTVFITTGPLDFSHKTADILSGRDRVFIAFAGFKGLTTAVLALLSYVTLAKAEYDVGGIQFANILLYGSLFLILISGTIQGLLLPTLSTRLDAYEEEEISAVH
ncbi:MAG: cation:proton antiporter domain-containing protein [Candidatus Kariarchaeaceae archaeon]|jgi:CPA1 family monovalent cation:H+ antiporter